MHDNKEKIIGSLTMQTFWVTLGDKGIPCALKGGGGEGVPPETLNPGVSTFQTPNCLRNTLLAT